MKLLLVSLSLALSAASALAWSSAGHMVIAAQAYRELSPKTKARVDSILNAHPDYARRACARLSDLTGLDVRETGNHFHAQAALDAAIAAHGALRTVARIDPRA